LAILAEQVLPLLRDIPARLHHGDHPVDRPPQVHGRRTGRPEGRGRTEERAAAGAAAGLGGEAEGGGHPKEGGPTDAEGPDGRDRVVGVRRVDPTLLVGQQGLIEEVERSNVGIVPEREGTEHAVPSSYRQPAVPAD
jgi:hypothetical protein